MVPAKPDCGDFVTRRECDSMHNSSKFVQGSVITLIVGLLAVGIWGLQVSSQADARSQRNESTIDSIQGSIVEVKATITKGFDDIKMELKDQRERTSIPASSGPP